MYRVRLNLGASVHCVSDGQMYNHWLDRFSSQRNNRRGPALFEDAKFASQDT